MGAGTAKGVKINDEGLELDDNEDRFSMISQDSPEAESKVTHSDRNTTNAIVQSKIRSKLEQLYDDESDEGEGSQQKTAVLEREDEKKRGLFGFARRNDSDDKTSAFVHESEETKKNSKKEGTRGFKLFNFRKKSEEKDEPLDQEIKDLQRTFDSLGIVGRAVLNEEKQKKKDEKVAKQKSQSADDIRDLEPMRNRMNQRRRFSRPINMHTGHGIRRGEGLTSSGGTRRTFKYSWETDNNNSSPVRSEEWEYEAVVIEGFDIEKFKKVNFEDSLINGSYTSHIPNSVRSSSPSMTSTESGRKSPLVYDVTEQRILATIERDYT